ncbi:hypothetical protein LSM04_007292 [Trypanosoma melophagium]|uniref:uncharacterized protein n=1 Tax=Trypanosoma melophagium TaxID=715481 RepID=UPI00351A3696|nr:hypothetical protein LSM04_007292 [Trypanosoma melophagium]
MPPKRGRGKDTMEEDNTPPSQLEIRLRSACSANAPRRPRMGHISYIHPKSGLLYVVGGCDVMGLPPILKSPRRTEVLEPLPFAEWWDRETRMWGVDCDGNATFNSTHSTNGDNNNNSNNSNADGDTVAVVDMQQFPIKHHPANVPAGVSWPTLSAAVVHWGPIRGKMHPKLSATCTPSPSSLGISSFAPHVNADDATSVDATPGTDAVVDSTISNLVTLEKNDLGSCKGGVGDESNIHNVVGEVSSPTSREHPVVLFIGGWQNDSRVSRVMGVDLDTGKVLQGRGGSSSSPLPTTCSTGSTSQESLFLFGGNTTTGYLPSIKAFDLSTCKWGERGTGTLTSATGPDKLSAEPLSRSSHVAGLLMNRYIVVHGGRRLAPFPTGAPAKGKKVDAKTLQTIAKPSLEFCNDVAVYDVKKSQWVIPGINVSNLGPAPRYAHAACVLSPNELLLHGGIGNDGNTLSDAWILQLHEKESTVTISWVKLTPHEEDVEFLPLRSHHALAKEAGEERRVYVTGGISAPDKLEDLCIMEIPPLSEMIAVQQGPRRRTLVKETRRSRA